MEDEQRIESIKFNEKTYNNDNFDGNISVVICSHNRAHLIDSTIPTIYNQQFNRQFEILVIDDRGTDNLKDIVDKHNKLCENKIRYIRLDQDVIHPTKFGINFEGYIGSYRNGHRPFNVGIKQSKYNLIMQSEPEIFHLRNNMQIFSDYALYKNYEHFVKYWIWMGSSGALKVIGDGQRNRPGLKVATDEFFAKKEFFGEPNSYSGPIYKFRSDGFVENYEQVVKFLIDKKFEIGPCVYPALVAYSKTPLYLIRGYDEEMLGYGWVDNDLLDRLGRIGVCIEGCIHKVEDCCHIHLHHDCSQIPEGGYNHILGDAKRNLVDKGLEHSIDANRRNLWDHWGEVF